MRILLLCHYDPQNAAMITDHIQSFIRFSLHDVFIHTRLIFNSGELENDLNLDWFDVVVVHYSIFVGVDAYLSRRSKARLKAACCLKVVFLQDEYRFVQRSVDGLVDIDADIVFTCVPEHSIDKVYNDPRLMDTDFVNTLTGYVPENLIGLRPVELKKRKYHVSYRGRKYPDWHGSMGREKYEIGEKFLKKTRGRGLRTNISVLERHRVYGTAWIKLIQQSRAVLGVESGSAVFDFSGMISAKTDTKRLLLGKKEISYEILREKYFAEFEGVIDLAQISPRVFEAISLRTLCVLYEGEYSGLLKPHEHYLPLKKDFSNIDEVVSRLNDIVYISDIIANAYAEIAHNPYLRYKGFIEKFDNIIECKKSSKPNLNNKENSKNKICYESILLLNNKNINLLDTKNSNLSDTKNSNLGVLMWIKRTAKHYMPCFVRNYIKKIIM